MKHQWLVKDRNLKKKKKKKKRKNFFGVSFCFFFLLLFVFILEIYFSICCTWKLQTVFKMNWLIAIREIRLMSLATMIIGHRLILG